jgi:hypothetical protein
MMMIIGDGDDDNDDKCNDYETKHVAYITGVMMSLIMLVIQVIKL